MKVVPENIFSIYIYNKDMADTKWQFYLVFKNSIAAWLICPDQKFLFVVFKNKWQEVFQVVSNNYICCRQIFTNVTIEIFENL